MPLIGSVGRVVHCVSRLDRDEAQRLLWPTVLALADAGVRQCVLLLRPGDLEQARLLLPRDVPVVEAAPARLGWLPRQTRILRSIMSELQAEPVLAVHLHGRGAAFSGLRAMRDCGLHAPVFFHLPDDSSRRAPWLQFGRWLSGRSGGPIPDHAPAYVVVPGRVDSMATPKVVHEEVLAEPVEDLFFRIDRVEAAHPLIVTRGRANDLALAAVYAQLAVLLAGSVSSLQFAWIGEADDAVQAVLKAAQIQVLPCRQPHELSEALQQAWLYLAPLGDAADARGLVEAMAAGLPCVARRGTTCADLVIDGLSGYLCRRRHDLIEAMARLVDSTELRRAMGHAARERSLQRFSRHRFQASMLLAHGLTPAASQIGAPAAKAGVERAAYARPSQLDTAAAQPSRS